MKDMLRSLVAGEPDPLHKRNRVREYLQARILLSLQDHGAFTDWAFVGGTALRFLYRLPRYSEDLDFSLSSPGRDARFSKLLHAVQADLMAEAYEVDLRIRQERTVASAMMKFRGVLNQVGISPHRNETLSVRVEIDTDPPVGASLSTQVIRRHFLLNLLQYDPASLLAGKLHAVLTRKYTKGRDLYDLLWYLSDPDWPAPNLELLNNALKQTGWIGEPLSAETWRRAVAKRLKRVDWKRAREDVAPFLERANDVRLLAPENFIKLLETR